MATVTIDDQLQTEFQEISAPDEDFSAFLAASAKDAIARRKRQAAGRAEMQAMIDGPWHTLEESNERMRRKYNLPDLPRLNRDERADEAEHIIAAMDPKVREELEREGWL